jgi:hypothetical protein
MSKPIQYGSGKYKFKVPQGKETEVTNFNPALRKHSFVITTIGTKHNYETSLYKDDLLLGTVKCIPVIIYEN